MFLLNENKTDSNAVESLMLELNAMLTPMQIRMYKETVYDAHNEAFADNENTLDYEQ